MGRVWRIDAHVGDVPLAVLHLLDSPRMPSTTSSNVSLATLFAPRQIAKADIKRLDVFVDSGRVGLVRRSHAIAEDERHLCQQGRPLMSPG